MEHEVLLAASDDVPGEVAVVAVAAEKYLATWSADGKTRTVRFNRKGNLIHPPKIIPRKLVRHSVREIVADIADTSVNKNHSHKTFWPSRGTTSIDATGIDALVLDDGRAAVAMIEQSKFGTAGGAYLAILSVIGEVVGLLSLGPAGEYSDRIAAALRQEDLFVAWHDGMLGTSRIRVIRIDTKTLEVRQRTDFKGEGVAASPTLAVTNGILTIAWSETRPQRSGITGQERAVSAVKIAVMSDDLNLSAKQTLATSRFVNPTPSLAVSKDGLAIVFRDDEDNDDTPEYHFIPLENTGRQKGERQRISAADGHRGPSLVAGPDGFVGATIRSFQRNLLIGLNRMDCLGRKLGGEFQVYADKTDFVRVDIAENRGEMMLVYAEDRQNRGRILAGTVVCKAEK
jgi:hypothetical protein